MKKEGPEEEDPTGTGSSRTARAWEVRTFTTSAIACDVAAEMLHQSGRDGLAMVAC